MSNIAFEIVNKFDSLGLADVLKEFTKEEIETASIEAKDTTVKKKLSILAKNWEKALTVLSTIESLSEIVDSVPEEEGEDFFEDEEYSADDDVPEDPFTQIDWESEDFE